MNDWSKIASELGLANVRESEIHPHDQRERAELFHVRDSSGCTEFEYLNLIHAFVLATKPNLVLETGTFTGMGTIAIAAALSWNGFGQLITVDLEECLEARLLIERYGLSPHVKFVLSDAEAFCAQYAGDPFNLVFIDSGDGRLREVKALQAGKKLPKDAFVLLHDASSLRIGAKNPWGELFEKGCDLKGFTLPLSRGLRIMFTT